MNELKSKEFKILQNKMEAMGAEEIIDWVLKEFAIRDFFLASSMSLEGQVLADMLLERNSLSRIVMIDTGRLNQETYEVVEWTEKYYGVKIEIVFPDTDEVEQMVMKHGINLFYDSVEKRRLCCEIRKVNPLRKKLSGVKAWMTGLKRIDYDLRSDLSKVEWDGQFSILKFNPIVDWTEKMLWDYVRMKGIKVNSLYEKGYKSIGCEPCTRAIKEGEDARAGRWWWEKGIVSECGLHLVNGKLQRKNN